MSAGHFAFCFCSVLLLLFVSATSGLGTESGPEIEADQSDVISVAYQDEKWVILPGLVPFDDEANVIAQANFTNSQQETGWGILEIQTKESAKDELQAMAAGYAEGYLTRTLIVEQYKEFFTNDICAKDPDACVWLKDQFRQNQAFLQSKIKANAQTDPYWHQVNMIYKQMEGMSEGYKEKSRQANLSDEGMDSDLGIVLTNFIADFWDMVEKYKLLKSNNDTNVSERPPSRTSCSVLIKHIPEREDIMFAHNTWHEYRAMGYRFLKNYNLNLHILPDGKNLIPGHRISMSSYAGTFSSLDDFYITSANLAVTETSLFIYNKQLMLQLTPEGSVMEPARIMIANRLATSGTEWASFVKKFNSGTYNNQWMVVDYKVLKESPSVLNDGVLTVLEQAPGKIVVEDQTKVLREKSYWSSYNRAFYPEISDLVGAPSKVQEFGEWFTHDKTPRAKIFRRDHHKVHDRKSLTELMRYNDFENDPFAVVEGCTPARTPAGAIANRLDLADPSASCTFGEHDWMVGFWGYGCLDAKMTSKESFPSLIFTSVAGPTTQGHPPFQWSTTGLPDKPKFRPIDKFDFKPQNHTWSLNSVDNGGLKVASRY